MSIENIRKFESDFVTIKESKDKYPLDYASDNNYLFDCGFYGYDGGELKKFGEISYHLEAVDISKGKFVFTHSGCLDNLENVSLILVKLLDSSCDEVKGVEDYKVNGVQKDDFVIYGEDIEQGDHCVLKREIELNVEPVSDTE